MGSDTCLVIPTIREDRLKEFFSRWHARGLFDCVDVIVVEDNPKPVFDVYETCRELGIVPGSSMNMYHYSWNEIDDDMGADGWIIPRRSDTVRSFGYYVAWRDGYSYIMTLDDDCYPCLDEDGVTYSGAGFVEKHKSQLNGRTRWFSTLDSVKPRGVPYRNLGSTSGRVMLSHGLWTNVPDYDAPTQLVDPSRERLSFKSSLVPHGMYFPMCGMNLMWRREITPLMYHLLMGKRIGEGIRSYDDLIDIGIDRFGDIWCGVIAKRILDAVGLSVSTGEPYVRHERASDPFKNLVKEAVGIGINEVFWDAVDRIELNVDPMSDPTYSMYECYDRIACGLASSDLLSDNRPYFQALSKAMHTWISLFR